MASEGGWIEIYHYAPLWSESRIVYSKDEEKWITADDAELLTLYQPKAKDPISTDSKPKLISSEKAKVTSPSKSLSGYRVFRIKANSLKFVLCNETRSIWDNNHDSNYEISHSGAYKVGDGKIDRIGDADVEECERETQNKNQYIEIIYESSPLWLKCYMLYQMDHHDWVPQPGLSMKRFGAEANQWFVRFKAQKIVFAFQDGQDRWDNNEERNYRITGPGKYEISHGNIRYLGISDMDSQLKQL